MHKGEFIPQVQSDTSISDALLEVTKKRLGMTTVTDQQGVLVGIFTDGDLRRVLDTDIDLKTTKIEQAMSKNARVIDANALAAEALLIMQSNGIGQLVAVDEQGKPTGALNMQDLLNAGVL